MAAVVGKRKKAAEQDAARPEASLEAQRRGQLLQATSECIAESGLDRTTMRMVADRAGVTTGMVLYYFKNKRELIRAAVDAAFREFKERLDSLTDSTFGPERLENLIRASLSGEAPGDLSGKVALQFRKAALTDEEARQAYLDQLRDARERLSKSVRAGQEEGQLRRDIDDLLASDLIYCLVQGLATEEALSPEYFQPDRALEIGLTLLRLLSKRPTVALRSKFSEELSLAASAAGAQTGSNSASRTPDLIDSVLLADTSLSRQTAEELSASFRTLYGIAARVRANESEV